MWKDNGGGDFEQPPVGTHVARCVKVIDIGTQKGEFEGKANFKRQVIIGWELPNDPMTEGDYKGKPFTVSRFYTASLGEKANLRADLKNWRGRDFTPQELAGFDPKNIIGKCCMLSLTLNKNQKVRVTGVMSLPKGMDVPEQVSPAVYFSLDDFDDTVYQSLSDGYKKMINVSPEFQQLTSFDTPVKKRAEDLDDDIPFSRAEQDRVNNLLNEAADQDRPF